jgi:RNA polymerase sigma-70 factor (ECF subfamily)
LEDRDLLLKIKNPDTCNYGFNLLVRKYQERVYWHIRKMVIDHDDADDLVQEVFLKVWKNLGKFREDASLFTWIYRIATNESLNFLKKKRRKFMLPIVNVEQELTNKLESDTLIDGNVIEMKLQQALLKLPDKQRLVFNMRYYEELKYEDISKITGTSVGALKANYHHASKKIEELLNGD